MTVMLSTVAIAVKIMIGLTAEAVGKEDNYADDSGFF